MNQIIISENAIVKRNLKYSDGTALLISSLSELIVEVRQFDRLLKTLSAAEISDDGASKLIVSITQGLSEIFREGEVWLKIKMKKIDGNYTDTYQYDIDEYTPFYAVK